MRSRIVTFAILGLLLLGMATAQDSAARLFDEGRRALNQDHYREAMMKFKEVWEKHSESDHAGDALYWYAFALYRMGGTEDLHSAERALQRAEQLYQEAATHADAAELATRIRGELFRRGDAEAAQRLTALALALGQPPDLPPVPDLAQVLDVPPAPPEPGVPDPDQDLKIAALSALLHMDSDRAVPILKSVVMKRDEESAELRRRAVFLLTQKRTDETEEILLDVARNDPDPDVQGQAVFWLSQVNGEKAVEVLEDLLTTSTDPGLQEKAVFALSQHPSPRSTRILRDLVLNDQFSLEARERAVFWLGERKSDENYEFLTDLYGRVEETPLREKIIFSVSQMKGKEAGEWLFEIALDDSEPVELRKNALFWAGQRTRLPIDRLGSLYDSLEEREMKKQVIFVLSQRKDKEALDKLFEIARTEEDDVELRKQALFWLSQTRDERVVDFLEEILRSE